MAKEEKDDAGFPNYIGATNNYQVELKKLKETYKAQYKELYSREYEYVVDKFDKGKDVTNVHIMQFNMLADGLSGCHSSESVKDETAKAKTFVNVPIECLDFKYRGFRVIEEITRHEPDMLCVQECDQFEFLLHYLRAWKASFTGVFVAKSKSPCLKVAEQCGKKLRPDGVAIFYDAEKYEAVFTQKFGQKLEVNVDVDVPAVCVTFQHRITRKHFLVCCAHLKSTKNAKGEQIRLQQLQHLLPTVKRISEKYNECAVFFAVDLNTPNNASYSVVYDSVVFPEKVLSSSPSSEAAVAKTGGGSDDEKPSLPSDYIAGYGLALSSAYYAHAIPNTSKQENMEPMFTTLKRRADGVTKHTIDYVFYSTNKAKVIRLLSIPDEQHINVNTLLPGFEYPSDHFSLMCGFQLLN